ncbi:glucose-6-phosphate dehydrogenase [Sessilibacter corallicola]
MSSEADIVVFGGLGDLSLRKLIPSLYRSVVENQLSPTSRIILVSREDISQKQCLQRAEKALRSHLHTDELEPGHWSAFSNRLHYCYLDLATCDERWNMLKELVSDDGSRTRVFYFAIPPGLYGDTCENLSNTELLNKNTRVVVEKPLGYDRESADSINSRIAEYLPEESIYRIDHYLGKETVQNLMALRFGNVLFEPLWDCKRIDNVQITIAETVGLEGRISFYDRAGALRDMVQNHLLQMMCLLTMEPPTKLNADNIRAEKLKVLKSLRRIDASNIADDTVRGQYGAGVVGGKVVPGYQEELGGSSCTETFVAIRAHIDNWRWAGVPFYLRTGKRLAERFAEIVINYKPVTHCVFDEDAGPLQPNRLVIRLQPDERIQLTLMSKELNRQGIRLKPATLNLNFADTFKYTKSDAYQRLILDAVRGDPALFTHRDEVDQAWAWIDPIIAAWKSEKYDPVEYAAGSWGPEKSVDWFGHH